MMREGVREEKEGGGQEGGEDGLTARLLERRASLLLAS